MTPANSGVTMSRVVRALLGLATVGFLAAGFFAGDVRLYVASGAAGGLWLGFDFVVAFIFQPLEELAHHLLGGGIATGSSAPTRPSLDDTIRLLESHIARPTSRQVDVNAAIRLEEIYRTVKQDPERASEVIRTVRDRYPRAPELGRYDETGRPRAGESGV